jgi:hypothetical protein
MVRLFANFSLVVWFFTTAYMMGYLFISTTAEIRAFSDSHYWMIIPAAICAVLVMSYVLGEKGDRKCARY